jgi:hypothetical protein
MKKLINKLAPHKTKIAVGLMFLLSCVIIVRQNKQQSLLIELLNKTDTVKVVLCDTNCVQEIVLPNNFSYTFTRLQAYNPSIDSSTVIKFLAVADEFGLNNDLETLRWSIGQILLESGGKQCYEDGRIVKSNTGAIGIGQILGSTCLDFMVRKIDETDTDRFYNLGATPFDFAYDSRLSKKAKILKAKEWLGDETNNLIMWGYIMRNNIDKKKNMISALISYNVGIGGLNNFLKGGNKGYDHEYIKGIRQRINYVERAVNALSS